MVKVALCQMGSTGTAEENVKKMIGMAEKAAQEENCLDVIVFPEDSYFDADARSDAQGPEPLDGYFVTQMCALAKRLHVNLIPGTFMCQADNGKYYNTALFINRDGEIIGRYNKMHLMKAIGYDESQYVEGGTEAAVIDTDFGRIGLMVCYDLRFPELARGMAQEGADIIFVPAYFPAGNPLPPRTDHWDTLVKGTALFNLTYVVAVNQYGHVVESIPFGRSQVADPWGTIISQCSNREEIKYAVLDLDYQEEVRDSVASWKNRRPEYYTLH